MTRAATPVMLKNISWSVAHQRILYDLSLEIPAGETLAGSHRPSL